MEKNLNDEIEKIVDSKLLSMRNRKGTWPKVLFMGLILLAAGFAIGTVLCSNQAKASSGGTDARGCHTEKATGEKHCHVTLTNGVKVKVSPIVLGELDTLKSNFDTLQEAHKVNVGAAAQLEKARAENSDLRERTWELTEERNNFLRRARVAEDVAKDAVADMKDAEARAMGAGPTVSARCKRGVKVALESGWRFSSSEKAALRTACLQ